MEHIYLRALINLSLVSVFVLYGLGMSGHAIVLERCLYLLINSFCLDLKAYQFLGVGFIGNFSVLTFSDWVNGF